MKLTKEEFIEKYQSKFDGDDEAKIEFLEDISDTLEVAESDEKSEKEAELEAEIERLKGDNEMLKKRYIDRFLGGEKISEEVEEKIDEPEEEEVIDIKEI
ncbi:MAG: hypothetical protein IKS59_03415 [Aeriscardovia sp.]|nr:hypothetical protein [Aeriscardovia sp.]